MVRCSRLLEMDSKNASYHSQCPLIVSLFLTLEAMSYFVDPPSPKNNYHHTHALLLLESYQRLLNKPLLDVNGDHLAERLFHDDFALLSHDTSADPVFNYANQTAMTLFELNWNELIAMPSRYSAEPVNREERERLLAQVTQQGYIKDYAGVRIAGSGRRFLIEQAIVWNVIDNQGHFHGQAACFKHWQFLPET